MKKTLITLAAVALAPVALAAGVADLEYTNPTSITDSIASSSADSYTMVLTLDWDKAVDSLGIWSAPSLIEAGYSSGHWWKHGFQIFKGADQNAGKLFVEFKADGGTVTPAAGGSINVINTTYIELTSDYNVDGELTLTYTFDKVNNVATIGALTTTGVLNTVTSALPSNWDVYYDINNVTIGTPEGVVESIVVFKDEALTGSALQYAAKTTIPEPTTATLSLLALAGLAARRRRK